MPRLREGVVVAIIAAASAIFGTVVGAVVTYVGNQELQNRQVDREEARQRMAARAVARLLMSEYHTDADRLVYMIYGHEYDPASYRERTFVSRIGQEDRKLLAGRLSEQAWIDMSAASQEIEAVEADLEIHHGKGVVGSEERETFEAARSACRTAYTALTRLAEGKGAS